MIWVLEYETNDEWLLLDENRNILGWVLRNGYIGDGGVKMYSAVKSDRRRHSLQTIVQLTGTIDECKEALEKAVGLR